MTALPHDKHVDALKAFVLRARRIREHSIAQDPHLLVKLQNPQWTVSYTVETAETKIIMELPPEEQLESAAARVRPLILNDEPTYHAKVMNALLHFARASNAPGFAIEGLRGLKKQWASINPKGTASSYYEVMVQERAGAPVSQLNDSALAFAWIYGDVVHADSNRRESGKPFGVVERYRAAVPMVVRLMLLAMQTLRLIEDLQKNGILPELGGVFEEEVTVKDTVFKMSAQVFIGEYDEDGNLPEPPTMDEDYGEGWTPFSEAFMPESPPRNDRD